MARAKFSGMQWRRGNWTTWALMAAGLLTTSCAGVIGAGVGVAVVGAGVLAMTCYDRVSVTVTDKVTGTKLCDAKVTFTEDGSETVASSCYQAALSDGHYKMRVERPGLLPYEMPINVDTGKSCQHAVQTMWVALDRPNFQQQPQRITPPATLAAPAPPAPPAAAAPAPEPTSAPAPTLAPASPTAPAPAPAPTPKTAPAPAPAAPAPSSSVVPPPALPPAASAFPSGP